MRKATPHVVALMFLCQIGCGDKRADPAPPDTLSRQASNSPSAPVLSLGLSPSKPDVLATAAIRAFEARPFDVANLPNGVQTKGEIVGGLHWLDKAGQNWVVFSELRLRPKVLEEQRYRTPIPFQEESRIWVTGHEKVYLYAVHYRANGQGLAVVRSIKDKNEDCFDADLLDRFNIKSFEVMDVDEDGLGEATFAYDHGRCVTDMGNFRIKLFLLEDGEKHVVRGISLLKGEDKSPTEVSRHLRKTGDDVYQRHWEWVLESDREVSRYLEKWPKPFREHGRNVWDRIRWYD